MGDNDEGSVVSGLVWMIVLSILLFWLPIGPLIAGLVGGYKAGSVKNGILAALLPAIIIAGIVALGFGFLSPILGAVLGGTMFIVIGVQSFLLLVGAIIGGAIA